jgi:outer membrane immunogenic protein
MRKLLLSAVVLCASVLPSAAGGSLKDTAPEPVAAPTWYGPYIGVHVGGGWSSVDWTYLAGGTANQDGDGAFGGLQAGFNFRTAGLVWGIEADISGANIDGQTDCPNNAFTCDTEIQWLGSVRLRAGFASGNWLIYGTGGFGFGRVEISTRGPVSPATNGTDQTLTGWTAGGGVELIIDRNWTIKGEYLYYDLGDDTFTVDANLRVRADTTLHTAKIGFNYRF